MAQSFGCLSPRSGRRSPHQDPSAVEQYARREPMTTDVKHVPPVRWDVVRRCHREVRRSPRTRPPTTWSR
ncbi:hypothetical protein HBB16_04495 [Pseudonocardia sp. MCCB 268]|nr:hypothetical protein [Pseudonocardia cytotoxica]